MTDRNRRDMKMRQQQVQQFFGMKAKMLASEDVEPLTGHAIGGSALSETRKAPLYLDVSMKRFETVFPAAGSGNSAWS